MGKLCLLLWGWVIDQQRGPNSASANTCRRSILFPRPREQSATSKSCQHQRHTHTDTKHACCKEKRKKSAHRAAKANQSQLTGRPLAPEKRIKIYKRWIAIVRWTSINLSLTFHNRNVRIRDTTLKYHKGGNIKKAFSKSLNFPKIELKCKSACGSWGR
jgi:hypothetical protein